MSYSLVAHVGIADGADINIAGPTASINSSGADLAVLNCAWYPGITSDVSFSDNKGNTYTKLTKQVGGASIFIVSDQLAYCSNPTVGSGHTFSSTGSSTYGALQAQVWSGSAASSPLDQQNGAGLGSAGTTLATGSVTPSADNEILVTGGAFETGSGTASIDLGFTISDQSTYGAGGGREGGAMAYLVQTSLAAENPTWNAGGSANRIAVTIATFKAAAGAATGFDRRPDFYPGGNINFGNERCPFPGGNINFSVSNLMKAA